MPVDELRPAVHALMDRAKADLAELVAFTSVADPKQYPPEECEKAAQWVVDAFAEVGLQDVTASPTPDGSMAVHGHAPGPGRCADGPALLPLRRPAAARRGGCGRARCGSSPSAAAAGTGAARPTARATSSCTSPRCARCKQLHGGFPCTVKIDLRGLRGAGHRRPGGVRAGERGSAARRHDPRRRHRQLRRRRADAHQHAARHDEHRRHAAWARRARCTPACSAGRRPTRCSG